MLLSRALNCYLLLLWPTAKTMVVLDSSLAQNLKLINSDERIYLLLSLSMTERVCCFPSLFPFFNPSLLFSFPPQLSAVPCLCPPVHTRLILAWCPTQDWMGSLPAQEVSAGLWLSPHKSAQQPTPTPGAPWWVKAKLFFPVKVWFIVEHQI